MLLKVLIEVSEPDLIGHEDAVLSCLAAFAIAHSNIFKQRMVEQLPRLTDLSDDGELKRVSGSCRSTNGAGLGSPNRPGSSWRGSSRPTSTMRRQSTPCWAS